MSESLTLRELVREITDRDCRYQFGAYEFVLEAIAIAVKKHHKTIDGKQRLHVSGQQLLETIREYALDQFGPMAFDVFNDWGVKVGLDFGYVVFNMVNHGMISKTEDDSLDDFKESYSFYDAFVKPFQPDEQTAGNTLR